MSTFAPPEAHQQFQVSRARAVAIEEWMEVVERIWRGRLWPRNTSRSGLGSSRTDLRATLSS
ncbi:unnamed protein product [Cutaneotrichosporon oleaginosum]